MQMFETWGHVIDDVGDLSRLSICPNGLIGCWGDNRIRRRLSSRTGRSKPPSAPTLRFSEPSAPHGGPTVVPYIGGKLRGEMASINVSSPMGMRWAYRMSPNLTEADANASVTV